MLKPLKPTFLNSNFASTLSQFDSYTTQNFLFSFLFLLLFLLVCFFRIFELLPFCFTAISTLCSIAYFFYRKVYLLKKARAIKNLTPCFFTFNILPDLDMFSDFNMDPWLLLEWIKNNFAYFLLFLFLFIVCLAVLYYFLNILLIYYINFAEFIGAKLIYILKYIIIKPFIIKPFNWLKTFIKNRTSFDFIYNRLIIYVRYYRLLISMVLTIFFIGMNIYFFYRGWATDLYEIRYCWFCDFIFLFFWFLFMLVNSFYRQHLYIEKVPLDENSYDNWILVNYFLIVGLTVVVMTHAVMWPVISRFYY